jgi:hypothetical protein
VQVFRYIPLGQQLRARFRDSGFAPAVRLRTIQRLDGLVEDIHDSRGWRTSVLDDQSFMEEDRNIVLSLYLDGVNPWKKDNQYSMWPIVLTVCGSALQSYQDACACHDGL